MARPIVLSNGELHVGINTFGLVHDFYYPYVGLENHSAGKDLRHKVGVWVDGAISWLDDGSWETSFRYPDSALVGHTIAKNEKIGITLEFDDAVDSDIHALLRSIHVVNLSDTERDIRLFMHQAFVIGDSRSNTDTVQYLPDSNAILHYRGKRAFIVSGVHADGTPFDQHAVGLFGIEGREGTYRDAEDGELHFGTVEHGRVDSTIRFGLTLGPLSSSRVQYWIAAGRSIREALTAHKLILEQTVHTRLEQTAKWWRAWLKPTLDTAEKVPKEFRKTFIQSVMVIKSQMDVRGAIMASTDTSMLNYSRDAYAYSWPRDGAYAMWPLMRVGYVDEPLAFFRFCKEGLHPSGYLMHKYRADGALGSSWHPYVQDDRPAPPIQEDETALTLFLFTQFYDMNTDSVDIAEFYESFVVPMADFMIDYIDQSTGLPRPSYDLWEQYYMTTTYTTATVYAALFAAAEIADSQNDSARAVAWRSAANDIREAAGRHLYHEERHVFRRGLVFKDGQPHPDDTIDTSSVFGAFMFGLYTSKSEEMKRSIKTLEERFAVKPGETGLARYEDDAYRRSNPDSVGNTWFVTTLWLAQYYIEVGRTDEAKAILGWARDHAETNTMLAEQIDPGTGNPISPAPLTWSHAEYVATLLDLIAE